MLANILNLRMQDALS